MNGRDECSELVGADLVPLNIRGDDLVASPRLTDMDGVSSGILALQIGPQNTMRGKTETANWRIRISIFITPIVNHPFRSGSASRERPPGPP
jgi:hypothetical protein